MALLDWLVVLAFIAITLATGMYFARRASKSMVDYFVAGRSIPWWLAGTSMLATSFASDTPLHTTRALRENGLSGAWFYWNGIISGVMIAFVFAKLWRRAGVVTDNELIELRYAGKSAAWLRGGLALFKSLFLEILTMAWITLGMVKIVKAILGLSDEVSIFGISVHSEVVVVAVLVAIAVTFSIASGFWGVVTTDLAEFTIAIGGAIVLAFVAMDKVGGASGLREGLAAHAPMGSAALDFTPSLLDSGGVLAFAVYVGLQWWAKNDVDGSGQRAQRLLACKDERHAIAAGIWSLAVTWLIRSWPWYTTALASLVLYPHVTDHESVYPRMVSELMPIGLKGLMVASFFAAFMGTLEAHYNLTASYLVNDVYKRFVAAGRDERHYVRVSRIATLMVALAAGVGALLLPSILGAFRFKIELVAGVGLIYVLRWMWWRVTAKTEIVALLTSVVTAVTLNVTMPAPPGQGAQYSAIRLLIVVGVSALCSIAATYLSPPEPREHLLAFYRRVRPPARFWGPIARDAGPIEDSGIGWETLVQAVLAMMFAFCGMLGLGKLILGEPIAGTIIFALGIAAGAVMLRWIFGRASAPRAPAREP